MSKVIAIEYQIALFPNEYKIDKVGEVAAQLMSLESYFDPKTVVMNPFDMSFPHEVERVAIFSKEKSIKLSVSPKKLGFYWINSNPSQKLIFDFEKSMKLVEETVNILGLSKSTYDRVGFITTIIEHNDNPGDLIKNSLIKGGLKNALIGVKIRLTYKEDLKSHGNCNRLVTVSNGYRSDNPELKLVHLQHDLNTHEDDKLNWSISDVKKFISEAYSKSNVNHTFNSFVNSTR